MRYSLRYFRTELQRLAEDFAGIRAAWIAPRRHDVLDVVAGGVQADVEGSCCLAVE